MKNYKTTTFEELLNTVPSVDEGTLPKANNLPESEVLITKECDDFKITVYKNGLFVYAEGKRTTVFAVDRCASYVDPVDTSEKHIPYDDIKNLEWYFPLMMFGMSRMENNRNRQEQEHTAFSLNNDGSDYSVYDESVENILREAKEKLEYEEKMRARKAGLNTVMNNLTEAQRTAIDESYYQGKSRTQIGKDHGISQQAVSKNIDAGLVRARKQFKKLGIE